MQTTNGRTFSLMELLVDLRKRLIVLFVALVIGMGVSWNFSPDLLTLMQRPLTGNTYLTALKNEFSAGVAERFPALYRQLNLKGDKSAKVKARQLNYGAPMEPFFVQCRISLLAGLVLVLPVFFHQLWLLAAPVLRLGQKGPAAAFVLAASVAFCAGMTFFLLVIWPVIINFSLSYEAEGLQSWFNLSNYVNFCLRLGLVFGLIFELPVFTVLLSRLGLVSGDFLARKRKYALLASAVIAAFHADLLTMFVIMIPLYLMYETSVWAAYLFASAKKVAPAPLDAGVIEGYAPR
jgi:sec-independent protein translocase protein TatC